MQHGMEHRVGFCLKGIGLFAAAAGCYFFNILAFGELYCSNCTLVPEYFRTGPMYFILAATVLGVVYVVRSVFPIKYELRTCPHCGVTTEQFEKKREVNKKRSTYVCEKCGKENILPLCKKCRKPTIMVNDNGDEWYCAKDEYQFFSKEKRTVEHAKLDLENKPPETPETKKTDEKKNDDSKKKTKYCRECGASIPRDSKFCEECGATLSHES